MAGAPLGNQNAKGSTTNGAKPVYNMEEEAEAIEKWSKLDSSIHLAEFALSRGTYAVRLYDWRDNSIVFAEALHRARDRLALRLRMIMNYPNSSYNEKLFHRDIACHDELLRLDERDEKKFEAELKKPTKELSDLADDIKDFISSVTKDNGTTSRTDKSSRSEMETK